METTHDGIGQLGHTALAARIHHLLVVDIRGVLGDLGTPELVPMYAA